MASSGDADDATKTLCASSQVAAALPGMVTMRRDATDGFVCRRRRRDDMTLCVSSRVAAALPGVVAAA